MAQASPYQIPKEPGRWRALALAAVVHAMLLGFLWVGVRWQNDTPIAVEAEVWSPQIKEAAPVPPPEPEKQPEPVVKETPKAVEQPVIKQPDIALDQEKKRKEQKAREEKAREEKAREEEARKAELLKKQELAKKEAADKKRKEQEDQKRLDKVRDETMKRMLAQAGPGAPGSTGEASKTQGPRGSAEWAGRVKGKIISNIIFPPSDNVPGNPTVEYDVDLLPDGSVAGIRKTKSSGIPAFDEAVKSAIMKSQPYPKDKSGGVPQQFHGVHGLKDQ